MVPQPQILDMIPPVPSCCTSQSFSHGMGRAVLPGGIFQQRPSTPKKHQHSSTSFRVATSAQPARSPEGSGVAFLAQV